MHTYHIRYNTQRGDGDLVWRIFENGVEHLVRDFVITVPVRGGSTTEAGVEKWNLVCQGYMSIQHGVASIGSVPGSNDATRT